MVLQKRGFAISRINEERLQELLEICQIPETLFQEMLDVLQIDREYVISILDDR